MKLESYTFNRLVIVASALFLTVTANAASDDRQTGKFGDQGNGTYRNPIIAADYSDPDVIRVGKDFYMVTSTFQMAPGVSVLHSSDLVNWETIGAAIPDVLKLGPALNWDQMGRYGGGVYAPALRYHAGKFYVFVNCDSGEGFYVCTATNPAGPWTTTQITDKNGKPLRTHGWTDPCPFWDGDGKAYLASSRPGGHWFGYLFQMKPDGTQLLDADVEKMNASDGPYTYPEGGTLYSPYFSTEGNKIYQRNGYFYLQHIEFLDKGQGHGTYFLRSKNIYGTKENGQPGGPGDLGKYEILKIGDSLPGQGALVDTPDGKWYWIAQFNRMQSDGRAPNLVPVTWIDDWPVIGVDITDKKGKFSWQEKLPIKLTSPASKFPQGNDDFSSKILNPQWQWNYQPRAEKWSLTERPGFLRLHAFQPLQPNNFFKVGNVLTQRHVRSESTVATVKLDLKNMADGQEAGLAHYNGGKNCAMIAAVQSGGVKVLKYLGNKTSPLTGPLPKSVSSIWFRSTVTFDDQCTFAYSLDGRTFQPFGDTYKIRPANYRGDLVGIYTFNSEGEASFIDIDSFGYDFETK